MRAILMFLCLAALTGCRTMPYERIYIISDKAQKEEVKAPAAVKQSTPSLPKAA